MKEKEFVTAIVLAAGRGTRMGTKIQKQYLDLCGKIMSDEKRKKIHIDYAKNHSQNELFAVCIEEMSELTKHLTKIMQH